METISKYQRIANILQKAVNLGFEFNTFDPIVKIIIDAEDFIIINTEHKEIECPVIRTRNSQHVGWCDGKGFEFESDGEIIDFSKHLSKIPDTKIIHNTVVDSEGLVIDLFVWRYALNGDY